MRKELMFHKSNLTLPDCALVALRNIYRHYGFNVNITYSDAIDRGLWSSYYAIYKNKLLLPVNKNLKTLDSLENGGIQYIKLLKNTYEPRKKSRIRPNSPLHYLLSTSIEAGLENQKNLFWINTYQINENFGHVFLLIGNETHPLQILDAQGKVNCIMLKEYFVCVNRRMYKSELNASNIEFVNSQSGIALGAAQSFQATYSQNEEKKLLEKMNGVASIDKIKIIEDLGFTGTRKMGALTYITGFKMPLSTLQAFKNPNFKPFPGLKKRLKQETLRTTLLTEKQILQEFQLILRKFSPIANYKLFEKINKILDRSYPILIKKNAKSGSKNTYIILGRCFLFQPILERYNDNLPNSNRSKVAGLILKEMYLCFNRNYDEEPYELRMPAYVQDYNNYKNLIYDNKAINAFSYYKINDAKEGTDGLIGFFSDHYHSTYEDDNFKQARLSYVPKEAIEQDLNSDFEHIKIIIGRKVASRSQQRKTSKFRKSIFTAVYCPTFPKILLKKLFSVPELDSNLKNPHNVRLKSIEKELLLELAIFNPTIHFFTKPLPNGFEMYINCVNRKYNYEHQCKIFDVIRIEKTFEMYWCFNSDACHLQTVDHLNAEAHIIFQKLISNAK